MITKAQFDWLFSKDIPKHEYDKIIGQIDKRFSTICQAFCRICPGGGWFDYDTASYADENVIGHFDPNRYKDYIGIIGENINPPPGYDLSFPTRWLWEDFEDEVKQVSNKYNETLEIKKQRDKKRKEDRKLQRDALVASVKSKLTPAELKVIKFK